MRGVRRFRGAGHHAELFRLQFWSPQPGPGLRSVRAARRSGTRAVRRRHTRRDGPATGFLVPVAHRGRAARWRGRQPVAGRRPRQGRGEVHRRGGARADARLGSLLPGLRPRAPWRADGRGARIRAGSHLRSGHGRSARPPGLRPRPSGPDRTGGGALPRGDSPLAHAVRRPVPPGRDRVAATRPGRRAGSPEGCRVHPARQCRRALLPGRGAARPGRAGWRDRGIAHGHGAESEACRRVHPSRRGAPRARARGRCRDGPAAGARARAGRIRRAERPWADLHAARRRRFGGLRLQDPDEGAPRQSHGTVEPGDGPSAEGGSGRRRCRARGAHARRADLRRGVLQPWNGAQAAGRFQGSRARPAGGRPTRPVAGRRPLHARRRPVADAPAAGGDRRVPRRHCRQARVCTGALHARHGPQAARETGGRPVGVPEDDLVPAAVARGVSQHRANPGAAAGSGRCAHRVRGGRAAEQGEGRPAGRESSRSAWAGSASPATTWTAPSSSSARRCGSTRPARRRSTRWPRPSNGRARAPRPRVT